MYSFLCSQITFPQHLFPPWFPLRCQLRAVSSVFKGNNEHWHKNFLIRIFIFHFRICLFDFTYQFLMFIRFLSFFLSIFPFFFLFAMQCSHFKCMCSHSSIVNFLGSCSIYYLITIFDYISNIDSIYTI